MTPNIVKKQKLYVKEIQDYIKLRNEYSNTFTSATWSYDNPATALTQNTNTDTGNSFGYATWNYNEPATNLITPIMEDLPIKQIPSFNFVKDGEIEFFGQGRVIYGINEENTLRPTDNFAYGVSIQNSEEITPDGVSNVFNHSLGTSDFTVYVNGFVYTNVVKTSTTVEFDFIPRRMDFIELKATVSNDLDFSVILQGTTEQETELTNYTELAWKERKTEKNSQHADYSRTIRTTVIKYDISLSFNDIKQKKEFFMEYQNKDFMLHVQNEDGTNEYFAICKIIDNSEKNYFDRSYSLSIEATNYWRDI
jgi:hypothetical protein